ncbi:MAG: TIGR04076 family protein [Armatimonadota bacterium]|nr:MAG: TIGR04076 family protein [Armatimonadota bacterium]
MHLEITVKAIRGQCPVYKVGDRIVLRDGYRLDLEASDAVCMHSLASVMPYYNAVFRGVDPKDLGLADPEGRACVQCLDPCEETGGGTVILRLEPK